MSEYEQEISEYNHTLQTNPLHREEVLAIEHLQAQDTRKTIELKQPALSSSSRWLQTYKKGH